VVVLLLGLAIVGVLIARGEIVATWPAAARLYALAGLPATSSERGLELAEVIPARTANGLVVEGDITNTGSTAREVPRLRVALRDPSKKETQCKIIDPPATQLGPGETAHFKTAFENADETATVKVSFFLDGRAPSYTDKSDPQAAVSPGKNQGDGACGK